MDNQGAALDTSSMTKPGSIAHDATGEGHGKLVRNILDAKNEMEAQVRAARNSAAILAQFWRNSGGIL